MCINTSLCYTLMGVLCMRLSKCQNKLKNPSRARWTVLVCGAVVFWLHSINAISKSRELVDKLDLFCMFFALSALLPSHWHPANIVRSSRRRRSRPPWICFQSWGVSSALTVIDYSCLSCAHLALTFDFFWSETLILFPLVAVFVCLSIGTSYKGL